MKYSLIILFAIISVAFLNCGGSESSGPTTAGFHESADFKSYWEEGVEICSYDFEESVDSTVSSGTFLQMYSFEGLSRRKLVQLENTDDASHDLIKVFKQDRSFHDGEGVILSSQRLTLYTEIEPGESPKTVKLAFSAQNANGQSYQQMKLFNDQYRVSAHSHQEAGDLEDTNLKRTLLEDELWSFARLNPNLLPEGKFQVVPSAFFLDRIHRELEPLVAVGKKSTQDTSITYTLEYTQPDRKLTLIVSSTFPNQIIQCVEEFKDDQGKPVKITSKLKAVAHAASVNDARRQLNLALDSLDLDSIH